MLKKVGDFVWKHKTKIVVISALAIAAAAYHQYSSSNHDEVDENEKKDTIIENKSKRLDLQQRSKLSLKANKQFDSLVGPLLMTLRSRVTEELDIASIVRTIKEIRLKLKDSNEIELWEEIKILSFSMIFVNSIMMSIFVGVLRLQIYLVARLAQNMNIEANEVIFSSILERTYEYSLHDGLLNAIKTVRAIVEKFFAEWTIQKKLTVDYAEFESIVNSIRCELESQMTDIIHSILSGPMISLVDCNVAQSDDQVNFILSETFRLIKSRIFCAFVQESVESCVKFILGSIKLCSFENYDINDPSDNITLKTPALAHILPQIKALSQAVLTENENDQVIQQLKGSALLDLLCVSILDDSDLH